jgi:ribonuclease HI
VLISRFTLAIYADDITIMCRGTTRDELRHTLQGYLDTLMAWFKEWKFKVNPTKCSQQIFTRKRTVPDVILRIDNAALSAVADQRVLGVIFDAPNLNFAKHVDALKIDGKKRLNFLKAISSPKWGADRNLLRQVYIGFVRSKLEYGSILMGELPTVTHRKLEVLQNIGLRCILGARKTTPILSMEVEAYIPPIGLRFRYLTAKWYIKLMHRRDTDNTVKSLELNKINSPGTYGFRATTVLNLLQMPAVQRTATDIVGRIPPWRELWDNIQQTLPNREAGMNTGMQSIVRELMEEVYPGYVEIYTDGSKMENGSVASAVYTPCNETSTGWLLNKNHTILGAELFAIMKALMLSNYDQRLANSDLVILTDSLSSLQLIGNTVDPSYKYLVFTIQEILTKKMERNRVSLQWVKSHSGIKGNEIADKAAVMSHNNDRTVLTQLNYDELMVLLQKKFLNYWTRVWKDGVIFTGTGEFYSNMVEKPGPHKWKMYKSRRLESAMTRMRLGHVGVASHMNRFNMRDSNICQTCGVVETTEHFVMLCTRYIVSRNRLSTGLRKLQVEFNLKNVLGFGNQTINTQKAIQKMLVRYLLETSRSAEL